MKNLASLYLFGSIATLAAAPLWAQNAPPRAEIPVVQNTALMQLTAGVGRIAAPGSPGSLALFSDSAFAVVAGKTGQNARLPVVAATLAGKARVVAFGHDGYLGAENLAVADTGKLFDNALSWVAGGKKPAKVGVYVGQIDTLAYLQKRGFAAERAKMSDLAPYDVLVINGHALQDADLAPLRAFLARGGGLVIATTGWGWKYGEAARLNADFVGNQLLAPFGLVWTLGTLNKTAPEGFAVEPISPLVNAQKALAAMQGNAAPSPEVADQLGSTLGEIARSLPPDDALLMPQLREIVSSSSGDIVPFARRPLTSRDALARLTLTLQNSILQSLPVSEIKAHPAGEIFPGDVPPNAKAITKTVEIDTRVPDWHSLGLYAAPGVPVTITLPDGTAPQGLSVRIGCHTDELWNLDSWQRFPQISRSSALQAGQTTVSNPFGGLIYVVVPNKIAAQNLSVTVKGAFAAPLFVAGKTDLAEWKDTLRWAPAPWAEIATDKIILTVPSRAVRDLEEPTALCQFYDAGLDGAADLYGISRARKRPERIVADVQISAGYMHSGYPIMTWLDVEKTTVDLATLSKFPWGHSHEIGHNHQQPAWTFAGTGEVTNNLLPLYVWTTILKRDSEAAHPALAPEKFAASWAKYTAGGRDFEAWKSDPFLALEMYIQLQKAFGWEPFKQVFAAYAALPDAQKPVTELQKHDEWMTRMARATGRDLGPFFQKWNVPTSTEARASIANLPAWMPVFPGETK